MHTDSFLSRKLTLVLVGAIAGAVIVIGLATAVRAITDDEKDTPAVEEPAAQPEATTPPGEATTTVEPEATAEPQPTAEPAETPPVASDLVWEPPRYWKVQGVDDAVNVRQEPGTDSAVLTTLAPDTRALLSTGSRVEVDGTDWLQIRFDDSRMGWVSTDYLAADDSPRAIPAHWDCWTGRNTRYAVTVLFDDAEGAEFLDAIMRSDFEDGTEMAYVRVLDRTDSSLKVRISQTDGSKEKTTWTVDGDTMTVAPEMTLSHVSCQDVAGYLDDMYAMWATE